MSGGVSQNLAIFVPGRLVNPLNGSWGGWRKHARLAKSWRERTAERVRVALLLIPGAHHPPAWAPKRVTFTALVARRWDDDNLPAAVKPIRDGLVDARVLHEDGPDSGHAFEYTQRVTPRTGPRGCEVTVALRGDWPEEPVPLAPAGP